MISAKDLFKKRINLFNDAISDNFDYDFSSVTVRLDSFDEFDKCVLSPYDSGIKLFYRGERINSPRRTLIPTMLRQPRRLLEKSDYGFLHIDSSFLYDYYSGMGDFVGLFSRTMGRADAKHLYDISAFAQHYCQFSPLIDFSKSLYPALSFALKNREVYEEDIVLYVLELKNNNDYTTSKSTADKWLNELNINLSAFNEQDMKSLIKDSFEGKIPLAIYDPEEFKKQLEFFNTPPAPTAKLIDVPTNTRMKFQKGVFLFLNDFHLFGSNYFTKNIRNDFVITKYVISKDICPKLLELVKERAPWYSFEYLTNIEGAFNEAINSDNYI